MRRRRSIAALITLAAGAAAALPIAAMSAPGDGLPDLFSQPAGPAYTEVFRDGRLLLRFEGYVPNAAGAGVLEVRSSDPDSSGRMRNVTQYTDVSSPGAGGIAQSPPGGRRPVVIFERADDHAHYHLKNAAEYSLWTADRSAQVALAQKTESGFCLEDSETLAGENIDGAYSAGSNNFCWQVSRGGSGGQAALVQGISPGFRDVYSDRLSFQWVDVSRVTPGSYQLATRVDPDNVIRESAEGNNGYAFRPATVPGYVAQPVATRQSGGAQTITLAATRAGDPGPRAFRIVTPPQNGTLSRPAGQDFSASTVTYTPNPGFRGADSFTYIAVDETSRFPLNPPAATVTLADNSVAVAISGAPPSILAGTSVQLTASVTGGSAGVTWSVDGVPGGNAAVGTVTPSGLYSAPVTPPPAGAVTVRAASVDQPSASAESRIAITPPPPAPPAPLPPGGTQGGAPAPAALLTGMRVGRIPGRGVAARVTPGATGRIAVTVYHRTAVAGRCTARVQAGRAFTCRVRLRPSMRSSNIRAIAVLRPVAGGRATAQASLARPARRASLTVPRATRSASGRTIVVRLAARRAGTVNVAARHGGQRVDQCIRRLTRPAGVVCRLRLGRELAAEPVRVVVLLKARGGIRATRALTVRG